MEDYTVEVTQKTVDDLCDFASERDIETEVFEGSLIDNYIFHDTSKITMGSAEPRKYIIMREKYVNSQSSVQEMIMTDSEETMQKWRGIFTEGIEEEE